MSLGSIAHLQYYFARTGLLDGKGAQMAKAKKKDSEAEVPKLMLPQQGQLEGGLVESPIDEFGGGGEEWGESEPLMLPPTVSTYSVRNHYIPPPPDLETLRKDLESALANAKQDLKATKDQLSPKLLSPTPRDRSPDGLPDSEEEGSETPANNKSTMAWHEIEGMHILDVVTLAIRAARIYYTAHENPARLAKIKSERKIREELLSVLDVLKRWASRNFAGGLRDEERAAIFNWITDIGDMLDKERKLEEKEIQERAHWRWVNGDWTEREREREELFIRCLETSDRPLPSWISAETNPLPTEFLDRLRDGRDLVRFHNEAVRLSRRHFGEIRSFHEDVAKPYRRADNIRYWIKAAEIRWEVKLDVDVMAIATNASDEAWKKFDVAIMIWCKTVREELIRDWRDKAPHTRLRSVSAAGDVRVLGVDAIS